MKPTVIYDHAGKRMAELSEGRCIIHTLEGPVIEYVWHPENPDRVQDKRVLAN